MEKASGWWLGTSDTLRRQWASSSEDTQEEPGEGGTLMMALRPRPLILALARWGLDLVGPACRTMAGSEEKAAWRDMAYKAADSDDFGPRR